MICGCCGARMIRKTNRYKDKEYHYYYCPTGKKSGCTNPVMVKESDLMECVRDSVKGFVNNVVSLEEILSGINQSRINKELIREYSRQIAQNNQQLEQIRTFKTSLYENMVSGLIEKHEFLNLKNTYNVRITQLEQAIAALEEKRTDVMENRSERNRWIENFKRFSEIEELDRKVMIQLVHSIKVVGKNEFQIEFNYQNEYVESNFSDCSGTGKDGGLRWQERAENISQNLFLHRFLRLSIPLYISAYLWKITKSVVILSKHRKWF